MFFPLFLSQPVQSDKTFIENTIIKIMGKNCTKIIQNYFTIFVAHKTIDKNLWPE
jgi:hypothetical protein